MALERYRAFSLSDPCEGREAVVAAEAERVVSALLMWRRLVGAIRYAMREEDFGQVLSAGVTLIVIGTLTYSLGNDWSIVDGFYFSVATLTTSSTADPHLVISDPWMKIFTSFYVLIGIGILVEIVRRFGVGFIQARGAASGPSVRKRESS